jgi:polyisoprenoid-binding protein YceI
MALLLAMPAHAAPVRFLLQPGSVEIGFRAYGLGMIAINGQFRRFHGTLTLDDADPAACDVALEAESSSLQMPSASMTADAQGPDLLDVERYPDFRIAGRCEGGRLPATLLLHGTSRPLMLDIAVAGGSWSASGMMRRADWGMGARPLLAGPEVRISMTAGLPPNFRRAP